MNSSRTAVMDLPWVAVAALKSFASFTSTFRFILLNPSFRGIAHLPAGGKDTLKMSNLDSPPLPIYKSAAAVCINPPAAIPHSGGRDRPENAGRLVGEAPDVPAGDG